MIEDSRRTEELFAPSTLFNDFYKTRSKLLNRGHVVRQNTHLAGFRGYVDLNARSPVN